MNAPVLPSVHDVMPETLTRVAAILDLLRASAVERVTLLVVPGRDWRRDDLDQLRRWQDAGYELAGHGWHHHVERVKGLYARLHSRLLSRRAGEHLGLDHRGIIELMTRNHGWFRRNGLRTPSLYVPPAWALGALPRHELRDQPYRYVETLAGVHDTRTGTFHRLPVVGFEADTRPRAASLSLSNALMQALSARRPLRLAIHPDDPTLYLRRSLTRCIAGIRHSAGYAEAARGRGTPFPSPMP